MNAAQTHTPISALRILFVCDAETTAATSTLEACHRLCDSLVAVGVQPVVLQTWPAAARSETRTAAKTQERPYPVYCSTAVRTEATLLSLVVQPSLAITLGVDPIGLAQPLLRGGLSCIAWFINAASFQTLPSGTLDRRLGLAAASLALANQLSALTGTHVSTLIPPLSGTMQFSRGGDTVLIPSMRRVDGIQRTLQMARARPHIQFVAIAHTSHVAAEQALPSDTPSNVTILDVNRAASNQFHIAVLPSLSVDLPWDTLAHCLTANLPILASSEPLLEDAIGEAGLVIPISQPLAIWLDAFDQMLEEGIAMTAMAAAAGDSARGLRLPAPLAAQQCTELALRHVRASGHLSTGRI